MASLIRDQKWRQSHYPDGAKCGTAYCDDPAEHTDEDGIWRCATCMAGIIEEAAEREGEG